MTVSFMQNRANNLRRVALDRWIECVRSINDAPMQRDRQRWTLHAAACLEGDLQAWYHRYVQLQVQVQYTM